MKFKFCGDNDCPDWILSEITTMSKISSIKLKLFCQQVVNELLGEQMNYEKIEKFTADAKYTVNDIKATIAVADFILTNSVKFKVETETLTNELQQLGLPKELSTSISKVYNDNYEKLRNVFKSKSLRLSTVESVHWRVDYVLGSSALGTAYAPEVQVLIKQKEESGNIQFTASAQKFQLLLKEMKEAYRHMEHLSA